MGPEKAYKSKVNRRYYNIYCYRRHGKLDYVSSKIFCEFNVLESPCGFLHMYIFAVIWDLKIKMEE